MLKLCAIASLLAIIAPLPAIAYTQQDADACTPDAFRLCQNAVPDEARVAHCLGQNKSAAKPRLQDRIQPSHYSRYRPRSGRPLDIHNTNF